METKEQLRSLCDGWPVATKSPTKQKAPYSREAAFTHILDGSITRKSHPALTESSKAKQAERPQTQIAGIISSCAKITSKCRWLLVKKIKSTLLYSWH